MKYLFHLFLTIFLSLLSLISYAQLGPNSMSTQELLEMSPEQLDNYTRLEVEPLFRSKDNTYQNLKVVAQNPGLGELLGAIAPGVGNITLITDHGPKRVTANLAYRGKGDLKDIFYFSSSEHANRFGDATHIEVQTATGEKYIYDLVMESDGKAKTFGKTVLGDFVMVKINMEKVSHEKRKVLNNLKPEKFTSIPAVELVKTFGPSVFGVGRQHYGSLLGMVKDNPGWWSKEEVRQIENAEKEALANLDHSDKPVGDIRVASFFNLMADGLSYDLRDVDGHNKDKSKSVDAFLASPWRWVVASLAYNGRFGGRSSGMSIKMLINGTAYSLATNWTAGTPDNIILTQKYQDMIEKNPSLAFGRLVPVKQGNVIGLRLGDANGKFVGEILPAPYSYGSDFSEAYEAIVRDIAKQSGQDAKALSNMIAGIDKNNQDIQQVMKEQNKPRRAKAMSCRKLLK